MNNNDIKKTVISAVILTVLLSAVCLFIDTRCAILCFLLGAALTAIFVFYTVERIKKLQELNNYLSQVCSGNFDLDIKDNSEGELSILKNNLFKVITMLKTQNEYLEKDKVFLANSLADISHQIKTPLTSITVMTDLLRDESSESKRSEFVGIIEEQLEKMKWLITNLLKMSKLDAGTINLKKEHCSSAELINSAVQPFIIMLELKNIAFENKSDDFLLYADKGWTAEAMQNIIKNCIEHTRSGGIIRIQSIRTNVYDSIVIKDTGCGISEDDLPHIFERFYHGKNSSSESVGIGLALSKVIFEKENAEIKVSSVEGCGSEFELRFYKSII